MVALGIFSIISPVKLELLGAITSKPEPQDEDGHGRESWTPAQHTQAVSEVLPEVFDASCSPHVPALLLDLLYPAEGVPRGVAGLLRIHPRLDVVLDLPLEMEAQLFVHLAIEAIRTQQGHETSPKVVQ